MKKQPEGKIPPYDQKAEAAVLGAILINNDASAFVSHILEPKHFYVEAHRKIYSAMSEMITRCEVIDHLTLGSELKKKGILEQIGGAIFLSALSDAVVTVANVDQYVKIVRDLAAARKMIHAAQEVVARGLYDSADVATFLEESRKSVTEAACDIQLGAEPQHIDADVKEIINELGTDEPATDFVKTGIDIIDRTTGGAARGLVTLIAGRPAMGKSALALNIAENVGLGVDPEKTVIFTLEDKRKYLVKRILARYADVNLNDLNLGRVDGEGISRIIQASRNLLGNKPIWIEDSSRMTATDIYRKCVAHKMAHGLDLCIIDHLHEIDGVGDNDNSIIAHAGKEIRDMTKELGFATILVSQLNRGVEDRPDKRPTMRDIRGHGKIEEIARAIWFVYREGYYNGSGDNAHDLELIISKTNHGPTGMLELFISLSRMFVRSWDSTRDGKFSGPPRLTTQSQGRPNPYGGTNY